MKKEKCLDASWLHSPAGRALAVEVVLPGQAVEAVDARVHLWWARKVDTAYLKPARLKIGESGQPADLVEDPVVVQDLLPGVDGPGRPQDAEEAVADPIKQTNVFAT